MGSCLTRTLPSHTFSNDCSALGADCFRSTGACLHREPRLSSVSCQDLICTQAFFLTLTHLPPHCKASMLDMWPTGHEFDTLALKAPASGGEVPRAIRSPGSSRALSSEPLQMVLSDVSTWKPLDFFGSSQINVRIYLLLSPAPTPSQGGVFCLRGVRYRVSPLLSPKSKR